MTTTTDSPNLASQDENRPFIPNRNIGRSLEIFDPNSPLWSAAGSRTDVASHSPRTRTPNPQSPRSGVPRSGRSTPIDAATPTTPRIASPSQAQRYEHQHLSPEDGAPDFPLIICFHGSGDKCRRSWLPLARDLSQRYRVLLYERSSRAAIPESTSNLVSYLEQQNLAGPYVLIAHSHGGAFARCFLHQRPKDVAGMVLVETGQETVWDEKIQEDQEDDHVLGDRPLVVIKGNSLLRKWRQLEEAEQRQKDRAANGEAIGESDKASLMVTRNEMARWEKEDAKLKKRQLRISKKHRFINLPDVGHHVVRDAPAVVVEEMEWVMANLRRGGDTSGKNSRSSSRRPSLEGDEPPRKGSVASWFRKASLAFTSPVDAARRASR